MPPHVRFDRVSRAGSMPARHLSGCATRTTTPGRVGDAAFVGGATRSCDSPGNVTPTAPGQPLTAARATDDLPLALRGSTFPRGSDCSYSRIAEAAVLELRPLRTSRTPMRCLGTASTRSGRGAPLLVVRGERAGTVTPALALGRERARRALPSARSGA